MEGRLEDVSSQSFHRRLLLGLALATTRTHRGLETYRLLK